MSSCIRVASLDGCGHELTPQFWWRFQDIQKAIYDKCGIQLEQQRLVHGKVEIVCDSDVYASGILQPGNHALTVLRRPKHHLRWMSCALGHTMCSDDLPDDLCCDKGFLLDVIQHHPTAYRLESSVRFLLGCADCARDDLRLVVQHNPAAYEFFDEEARNDCELAEEAICQVPQLLQFAPLDLRKDVSFVSTLIKLDPACLQHAAEEIRGDPSIMKEAVVLEPHSLEMASADLKRDPELVMSALRREPSALCYAPELACARGFLVEAVKVQPAVMLHVSEDLRKDADFLLAAVAANVRVLEFIDKEFQPS